MRTHVATNKSFPYPCFASSDRLRYLLELYETFPEGHEPTRTDIDPIRRALFRMDPLSPASLTLDRLLPDLASDKVDVKDVALLASAIDVTATPDEEMWSKLVACIVAVRKRDLESDEPVWRDRRRWWPPKFGRGATGAVAMGLHLVQGGSVDPAVARWVRKGRRGACPCLDPNVTSFLRPVAIPKCLLNPEVAKRQCIALRRDWDERVAVDTTMSQEDRVLMYGPDVSFPDQMTADWEDPDDKSEDDWVIPPQKKSGGQRKHPVEPARVKRPYKKRRAFWGLSNDFVVDSDEEVEGGTVSVGGAVSPSERDVDVKEDISEREEAEEDAKEEAEEEAEEEEDEVLPQAVPLEEEATPIPTQEEDMVEDADDEEPVDRGIHDSAAERGHDRLPYDLIEDVPRWGAVLASDDPVPDESEEEEAEEEEEEEEEEEREAGGEEEVDEFDLEEEVERLEREEGRLGSDEEEV